MNAVVILFVFILFLDYDTRGFAYGSLCKKIFEESIELQTKTNWRPFFAC